MKKTASEKRIGDKSINKEKQFNLSDYLIKTKGNKGFYVCEDKIKEFIRLLKEWINEQHIHYNGKDSEDCDKECWGKTFPKEIDNLAGDKLT